MTTWKIKQIRLEGQGLGKFLGDREAEVMDILWELRCATVRDVCDKLCTKQSYSFNTIMTIMNRLTTKGLLKKSDKDGAYCYMPKQSKSSFIQSALNDVAHSIGNDPELKKYKA